MKIKTLFLMISIVLFVMGCNANVDIAALDSGAPVSKADITIYDSSGKTAVAQGPTGVDGSLKVSMPYGDYKIKGEKIALSADGKTKTQIYASTEGFLHVDLMGAMFGIKVELPMSKPIVK